MHAENVSPSNIMLPVEEIEIKTWVENIRRVRSLRQCKFVRKADGKTIVKGETDWVFMDTKQARRG